MYLTDLKKDLNEAEYELRNQKEMYTGVVNNASGLKKELISAQGIIKRYRKMVSEL